jgi:hypothetical protein
MPFYERDNVRELAKYLVQLGGVTIIDALAFSDIADLVNQKVQELSPATA